MSTGWPSMASNSIGLLEADQEPKGLLHLAEARVRDGDAAANSRGAEFIALFDLVRHGVRRQAEGRCGAGCQLLQQAGLVAGPNIERHIGRREEVFDLHSRS